MEEIYWADIWSIYALTATNSKTHSYQRYALGIVTYIPQSYCNTYNFYNTSFADKIELYILICLVVTSPLKTYLKVKKMIVFRPASALQALLKVSTE